MKTKVLLGICAVCIASLLGCEQQANEGYQTDNEIGGLYALYKDSKKYLVLGVWTLLFVCCGTHKELSQTAAGEEKPRYLSFYVDDETEFLEIEGDLNEHPERCWGVNHRIFFLAGERMEKHLYVRRGRLVWDVWRGKDIRISENLFEWFVDIWAEGNRKLETGRFKIKTLGGRKNVIPKRNYNLLGERVYGKDRKKKNKYPRVTL